MDTRTRPRNPSGVDAANLKQGLFICSAALLICLAYMTRMESGTIWSNFVPPEMSRVLKQVRHLAFLKVHKTGSSSVQNIFIRFGDVRHLTFILAKVQGNECNGNLNCISLNRTLHDGNIEPPPIGESHEILCSHVIYNRTAFHKYLPSDTVYIGLVREPISRLESAIAFSEPFDASLEQFADRPMKYEHPMINNRMAFDFGFKSRWFPRTGHKTLTKPEQAEVNKYVDQLMNEFDLILINERLDESLVLMKRLLDWTMKDIIYQRKLVRKHAVFAKKDRVKLKHYLYLDYLLYSRALESHLDKTSKAVDHFTGEVEAFNNINKLVNIYCECDKCMKNTYTINQTSWSSAFTVNQEFCLRLGMPEVEYLLLIRGRQRLNNTKGSF